MSIFNNTDILNDIIGIIGIIVSIILAIVGAVVAGIVIKKQNQKLERILIIMLLFKTWI